MSLNPNGITIQDLAYWLRQTYKNQYDHIESDRELVNHFKNTQPDMMDDYGGWDSIINEPTVLEELSLPFTEMKQSFKHYTMPRIYDAAETLKENTINNIDNRVDRGTPPNLIDLGRGLIERVSSPLSLATGGMTFNDILHTSKNSWWGKKLGLEDTKESKSDKMDVYRNLYQDYYPELGESLFSNETNNSSIQNLTSEQEANYWKNKDSVFNLSDAMNTIRSQYRMLIKAYGDKVDDIPDELKDLYFEWKNTASSIEHMFEDKEDGKPGHPPELIEGIVEMNEKRFVDLIGTNLSENQKIDLLDSQPYHKWESNYIEDRLRHKYDPSHKRWQEAVDNADADLENMPQYKAYREAKASEPDFLTKIEQSNWDGQGIKAISLAMYNGFTSMVPGIVAAGGVAALSGGRVPPSVLKQITLGTLTWQEFLGMAQESIQYQTQDIGITRNYYNGMVQKRTDELINEGYSGIALENTINAWKKDNFEISRDGNITLLGISPGDAITNSLTGDYIGTVATYLLESKLGVGRLLDNFGGGGRKWVGKQIKNNILNKAIWNVRKIGGGKNTFKWGGLHASVKGRMLKEGIWQGTEEILQETAQKLTQTMPLVGYKRDGFIANTSFSEMLEAFTGGFGIGAGMVGGSGAFQLSGLSDRLENMKISNARYDFAQTFVKRLDNGLFGVFASSPAYKRDNKGEPVYDDKQNPVVEGRDEQRIVDEVNPHEYASFGEAFQVAEQFNRNIKQSIFEGAAKGPFKEWGKAKTVIKKTGKSKYVVDVIAENGNLLKSVTFNSAVAASQWKATEDNFIADIEYNQEKTPDTDAPQAYGIIKEDGTFDEDALFIGGAHGRLVGEEAELWEDTKNVDKDTIDRDLNTPNRTLDIIKRKGFNVLTAVGMDKPTFMQSLKDKGWDQLHPEAYQEIDNILSIPTESETASSVGTPDENFVDREDAPDIKEDVVEREDVEITPEEEITGEVEVEVDAKPDERYKDFSDEALKEEYLKKKAEAGKAFDLDVVNLRAELGARKIPIPRVTKKVKERLDKEKKAPEVTEYKELSDEKLLEKLKEERAKPGVNMETIKVIAELKKRGVKVPPKPAKQKIKEEADKKKESITTAKKLIQEEKVSFAKRTAAALEKKFIDGEGEPLFKVVIIEDKDAQDVSDFSGKWDPNTNTIYLNPKHLKRDTAFHEFSHPFIRALFNTEGGDKLIKDIYLKILSTKAGKKIFKIVKTRYADDFEEGSYEFSEEVIAWALGWAARDVKIQTELQQQQNPLIQALKKFWNALKEYLFGPDAATYLNRYDFVDNGMTFKSLVDFMIDDKKRFVLSELTPLSLEEAINKTYSEDVDINFLGGADISLVEDGNDIDTTEDVVVNDLLLPSYFEDIVPALDEILQKAIADSKKGKSLAKHQKDLNTIYDRLIPRLKNKLKIPKSYWGQNRLGKRIDEIKEDIQKVLTAAEESNVASKINSELEKTHESLNIKKFSEVGLSLPKVSSETKKELKDIATYELANIKFKHLFIENHLNKKGKWTLKDLADNVTRPKSQLPGTEKQVVLGFIKEYKNNNNIKDNDIINTNSLRDAYIDYLDRNYSLHTGRTVSQGIIHVDRAMRDPKDMQGHTSNKRIMFFTNVAFKFGYAHETAFPIKHTLDEFKTTDTTNAAGWYRVSEVPGYEDVFVSMEYQSDFYNKDRLYYSEEISKYLKNPAEYIKSKIVEDTGGKIVGLDFDSFSVISDKIFRDVEHSLGYDPDIKPLNDLPAHYKRSYINYNKEFIERIYHKLVNTLPDFFIERFPTSGEFLNVLEGYSKGSEKRTSLLNPTGVGQNRNLLLYGITLEFRDMINKGMSEKEAYNSIASLLDTGIIENIESDISDINNIDTDMIRTHVSVPGISFVPETDLSYMLFKDISTGNAPKEFYDYLLNFKELILTNEFAIKDELINLFSIENIDSKYKNVYVWLKNLTNNVDQKYRKGLSAEAAYYSPLYQLNARSKVRALAAALGMNGYASSTTLGEYRFGKNGLRIVTWNGKIKKELIKSYRDNTKGWNDEMAFLWGFSTYIRKTLNNEKRKFTRIKKEIAKREELVSTYKNKKAVDALLDYRGRKLFIENVRRVLGVSQFANHISSNINKTVKKNKELLESYKNGDATIDEVENFVSEQLGESLIPIRNLYALEKPFHKIRALHSIQYMASQQSEDSTAPINISLGIVNMLTQGLIGHPSFWFYHSAKEYAWNSFIVPLVSKVNKHEDINTFVNNWTDKNGFPDESIISNDDFSKFLYESLDAGKIDGIARSWYRSELSSVQDFVLEKENIKGRDSNFVKEVKKVLKDLTNKGYISWEMATPEWSKGDTIQIKVLNREGLLGHQGARFQKVIDESKLDDTVPSDENFVINKVNKKVSYQKVEDPRLSRNAAINQIFENAWLDLNIVEKQKRGFETIINPDYFRTIMVDNLPEELKDRFIAWYTNRFSEWSDLKYTKEARGKNVETMLPQDDTESTIIEYFNEIDAREGFKDLLEKNESNERELNPNDFSYDKEFGVSVTPEIALELNKEAFNVLKNNAISPNDKFNEWVKIVSKKIKKRKYSISQKRKQLKKFNRLFSLVTINTELGKLNTRNNFYVTAQTKPIFEDGKFVGKQVIGMKLELKGPDNKKTGGKNNSTDKITPFELNNEKGLFSWISGEDFLEPAVVRDDDGYILKEEKLNKDTGEVEEINKIRKKERYNFFTADELAILDKEVRKSGFAIALSRGDSDKLALVKITQAHRDEATRASEYFDSEIDNGFIPDEKIFKDDLMSGDVAGNIAVHEALKKVFPNYLFMNADVVVKRFKLPFTPMTISNSMPSVDIYIADKENLTFKYREKTNNGWQTIKTVGALYIGDGGSITARKLFEKFEIHHGLSPNQSKAKTVIYRNQDDEGIAIKHQHYQPEAFIEIWEGDKLIAKVDKNGNFAEGEAAGMDMIVTQDEAKWIYGDIATGNRITVSGQDIGFTKYADEKVSKTGVHMMQWWNFVNDPNAIIAFKSLMLSNLETRVQEIFRDFSDTNIKLAADRIGKVLKKIDSNDPIGFKSTLIELNKLGFIWQLEPMLNVLYQNQELSPSLRFKNQPGTRVDLVPNLRGDLNPGEAALSKRNAEEVLLKYATANGISLADAKKANIKEINEWLSKNPVYMHTSRSPVPHIGGTMMTRIVRLFNRSGIVEMHPFDVFARLEGDYDGDWVSMEMLPYTYTDGNFISPMEDALFEVYKGLEIKGINLSKFDSNMPQLRLTNKEHRFQLIEAMTYNKQGEVVNVASLYGILVNTVDSINIEGIGNIVIKQPNDKVAFNVGKIDGKVPKFTVSELLRIYLQASVDNAKFMLLKQWGYTQEGLTRALFKYAPGHPQAGQTISAEAYKELRNWLNFLKKPNRIRKGSDFTAGKYNTTRTIAESQKYYDYLNDRNNYIKHSGEIASDNITVSFKGIITPVEELAKVPFEQYLLWQNKHKIVGSEGWPGGLNYNVHKHAYIKAVDYINTKSIFNTLLNNAIEKDSGLIEGNKAQWAKKEAKKGEAYAMQMTDGFYALLEYSMLISSQPSFLDKNEKAALWKSKYEKKFKQLSETAKLAATYRFLNGWSKKSGEFDKKAPRWVPPASLDSSNIQLLDEKLLSKFANAYNNEVANNRNINSRFDSIDDIMLEDFIEDNCG